ncbi:hypothetical protein ABG768_003287 [Culter alburnus]|uniref:Uncharacterized protein n=1 Tax=Culter alburnus TaxID=194366 RepID=A0AAW2A0B4_CULAL
MCFLFHIDHQQEFQHNSKTSFKLPPIFGPSQTRGLCPYPQAQGVRKPVVAYSVSTVQLEEDLFRQKCRSEFLEREKRKEALCPQRQHPSQEKSASLKRELKATKAPNANRVQLKGKEPEALERKVSEHKIKREEMVLTEPEEPEEGNSNPEEMDLTEPEDSEAMDRGMDFEVYLWHHKNDVDEFYDNMEVIKCHQYKIKKM